ncbi:hypothetical protein ACFEMC_18230 [Kineococcus sp. DHX-1]|uniref:hypothetical protein n=1 Tax=Kineococcus sp. DHX-1 TaxID=3349638 RepID=UPI0036D286EA
MTVLWARARPRLHAVLAALAAAFVVGGVALAVSLRPSVAVVAADVAFVAVLMLVAAHPRRV